MFVDRGLNDRWVRPRAVRRNGRDRYSVTLRETLGKEWTNAIVFYPFPAGEGRDIRVIRDGRAVPCQYSEGRVHLLVESLTPGEETQFDVTLGEPADTKPTLGVTVCESGDAVIFENGVLALKLPASGAIHSAAPGPLLGVRLGDGPWMGRGRIESPLTFHSCSTQVVESGPLWTTVEVRYEAAEGSFAMRFILRPGEAQCEVRETSTLPVRLWPAPRPYREIGSLAASHWNQGLDNIAKPCVRPCPTSNMVLDFGGDFTPNRLITHSTASWEIMDLPLGAPALKTYTAMRPALPSIDGGWFGVYDTRGDAILGLVPLDIVHWGIPDDVIHPAHRTLGANAEVFLVDSPENGPHFRFPIENVSRRWLLAFASRQESLGESGPLKPESIRREADAAFPLWAMRTHNGDLPLDKVKDWVTEWTDAGDAHPRVLCRKADFPAIRAKVQAVPELQQAYDKTRHMRSADRYIIEGELNGLAPIEEATHIEAILTDILNQGYVSRHYCIALARPLRRYVIACDIQWDAFTPGEKRKARRLCALGAYILSDGDWWAYVFRPGETTYLPNFNSDVFICAGIIGLFLSDHPCSERWVRFMVERMDRELKTHLRLDGGGEENVGSYLFTTWQQLYSYAIWALRHCRVKDYSTDPCLQAGMRFLLKALGPEDPRDGGLRSMPPIGHHPHAVKQPPLFSWLAGFVKDADPELASNLMWAWRAVGSPVHNSPDHSGPTANPFTRQYLMHDPTIEPVMPPRESHELPHVGAVLRSHDASGRGSYLFLKAGRVHSHHDDDEGSFHYFGRGVSLALDGLPLQNGATAAQHNAVTFSLPGQPSGLVEHFATAPEADYVRAVIAPRAFACDAMYYDGQHRSGFTRELLLVKAPAPGGIEYLVVKDTCVGPEAPQWNLDALSLKPEMLGSSHVWFPGHPEFDMGLDVLFIEPTAPPVEFEAGIVNPKLLTSEGRATIGFLEVDFAVTEHWLLHAPAGPGATFCAVLFPRRPDEPAPTVEYLPREETLAVSHAAGRDLIFLRPNPKLGVSLHGVHFAGRAGLASLRNGIWQTTPLDGTMRLIDTHPLPVRQLR